MTAIVFELMLCSMLVTSSNVNSETKLIESLADLNRAMEHAQPGDVYELAEGNYNNNQKSFNLHVRGTAEQPVIIRSKNPYKTNICFPIYMKGDFICLEGFRFSEQGQVRISGRGCRVTGCLMSNLQSSQWVRVEAGSHQIEIDRCLFENKQNNRTLERNGQLLKITVDNAEEKHFIHNNHFRDIPKGGGSNGFETVQLITRNNPFNPVGGQCGSLIQDNLFERCDGESEIISVKSNGNILSGNIFRQCSGSLVLRHGHNNLVTGNLFFGGEKSHSGGVRLQGREQVVVNNYFCGLRDFGVAMMDGTPDELYVRVERAKIIYNTFVDCYPSLKVGLNHNKHPNGSVPKDCLIAANIFYSEYGKSRKKTSNLPLIVYVQNDQPMNWQWVDNIAFGPVGIPLVDGLRMEDPYLELIKYDLVIPTIETPSSFLPLDDLKFMTTDLFSAGRTQTHTIGAIQYPVDMEIVEQFMKSVGL